jgi:hypothetical protein
MDYSWSSGSNSGNAMRRQLLIPAAIGQLFDRGFSTAPPPKCSKANPWVSNFQFKTPQAPDNKAGVSIATRTTPTLPRPGKPGDDGPGLPPPGANPPFPAIGGYEPSSSAPQPGTGLPLPTREGYESSSSAATLVAGREIVTGDAAAMIIDDFNRENAIEAREDMIQINGQALTSVPTSNIDTSLANQVLNSVNDAPMPPSSSGLLAMFKNIFTSTPSSSDNAAPPQDSNQPVQPSPDVPFDVSWPEIARSQIFRQDSNQPVPSSGPSRKDRQDSIQPVPSSGPSRRARQKPVPSSSGLSQRDKQEIVGNVENTLKQLSGVKKKTVLRNHKGVIISKSAGESITPEEAKQIASSITNDTTIEEIIPDQPSRSLNFTSDGNLPVNRPNWGQRRSERLKEKSRKYPNAEQRKDLPRRPNFDEPDIQPPAQLGPEPVFRGPIQGPDLPAPKRKNRFDSEQPNKTINLTDRPVMIRPRRSDRIIAQNSRRLTAITPISNTNIQASPSEVRSVIAGTLIQAENPAATPIQVAAAASNIPDIDPTLVARAAHNYNLRSRRGQQPVEGPQRSRDVLPRESPYPVRRSERIRKKDSTDTPVEEEPSGVRRSNRLKNQKK